MRVFLRAVLWSAAALGAPLAASAQIQVSPDNGTHPDPKIRLINSTGNSVVFTITNLGADASFARTCTGIGNVTSVTCTPLGLVAGGGGTKNVTATFATTGAGTGSVQISITLQGQSTVIGIGKWDETIVNPGANVTPDGAAITKAPNLTGTTQAFTVTNTSRAAGTYAVAFTCSVTGVSGCSISPTSLALDSAGVAGASGTATVTYNTLAAGTAGTITATASYNGATLDNGTVNVSVTAPTATITVTTVGGAVLVRPPSTASSQTFTVTQTAGTVPATYNLAPICTTPAATGCPASLSPITVTANNTPQNVVVNFTSGVAGAATGRVTLTATHSTLPATQSSSFADVRVVNATVTPVTASTTVPTNATGQVLSYTVTNTGPVAATFDLAGVCAGAVSLTPCQASPAQLPNLAINVPTTVTVTYNTGATPASGTVALQARYQAVLIATGTTNVTVTAPTAVVTVTPVGGALLVRPPTTASSQTFAVTQTAGTVPATYNLAAVCTAPAATTCPASLSPITLTVNNTPQNVVVNFTSGVAGAATGRVTLTATRSTLPATQSSSFAEVRVVNATVTPVTASTTVPINGTGRTLSYTVTNTGPVAATFDLTGVCAGTPMLTACQASPTQLSNLAINVPTNVSVTYNTGATAASGTVALQARYQTVLIATGTTNVSVAATARQAPVVTVARWNPGPTLPREQCVAVALGQGAAAECGDLRVVHVLPSVRTMSKERAPILLYNTAHAEPAPQVAVMVTLPAATIVPDSIRAILLVGSTVRGRASWPGTQWTVGAPRLIRVWDTTAQAAGTTIVSYTVRVYTVYNAPVDTLPAVTAQAVAVVNRQASAFGRGWWLDGLERLNPATMVWTGGDGSVRQYASSGLNQWTAPSISYPDLLTKTAVAPFEYTRILRAGTKVVFDDLGRHARTVNRVGHTTVFRYAGTTDNLIGIDLPMKSGTRSFTLAYPANQVTITDELSRTTRVNLTGGGVKRVSTITDADTRTVAFGYPGAASGLIVSRTDRVGAVVRFTIDSLHKVIRSGRHPVGSGLPLADSVIVSLTPAESRGAWFATSVDTVNVTTGIDGPRQDVLDSTVIWTNSFGAPFKVKDALNQLTLIERLNGTFAGAVTKLTTVSGQVLVADYDGRGRLWHLTDQSVTTLPTTFTYDATGFDQLTRIDPPEGDFTVYGVNATTGNRDTQQDSRGLPSQITFGYDTGLLSSVTYPGTAAQRIHYDGQGNADSVLSALAPNRKTTYASKDNAGRPATILTDVDAARDQLQVDSVTYNQWNQDSVRITTAKGERIRLDTPHDREGRPLAANRTFAPDPKGIGALSDGWTYDLLGRAKTATKAGGGAETRGYDPAGNLVSLTTPRGDAVTGMGYDGLNRLLTRSFGPKAGAAHTTTMPTIRFPGTVPYGYTAAADAEVFDYAPGGQIKLARNCDAEVQRSIHASGRIDNETLKVRNVNGTCNVYGHTYVVGYTYDQDNRRKTMTAPAIFTGAPMQYGYNPATGGGRLTNVTDLAGNGFGLLYKPSGELLTISYPGSVVRTFGYNDDGDLTGDLLVGVAGPFPGLPAATIRNATFTFDGRGKMKTGSDAARFLGQTTATYSGLGYLTKSVLHQAWSGLWGQTQVYGVTETFTTDALGNEQSLTTVDSLGTGPTNWTQTTTTAGPYAYAPASSQLQTRGSHTYQYDAAGNQEWELSTFNFERASYYDVVNRLRRTDLRTYSSAFAKSGMRTVEDYRYDALGRRIWMWTQTQCDEPQVRNCVRSHLKRTIWDGSTVLAEIQAPGDTAQIAKWETDVGGYAMPYVNKLSGSPQVADLHYDPNPYFGQLVYAPGVTDQPLSVTRYSYTDRPDSLGAVKVWPTFTFFPHWDRRGVPILGTFPDGKRFKQFTTGAGGTGTSCLVGPGFIVDTTGARCVVMHWLGSQSAYDLRHNAGETWAWHGSLLEDQRDGSGWGYRRARLVDPLTGRFTQVDPIGVAGGLNLYGFAGGDPVNFGDPSGLCPYKYQNGPGTTNTNVADCPQDWVGDAFRLLNSSGGAVGKQTIAAYAAAGIEIITFTAGPGQGAGNYDPTSGLVWLSAAAAAEGNAARITHEGTHIIEFPKGTSHGAQEMMAWRRAFAVYGGLNQTDPFYNAQMKAWAANPMRFMSRLNICASVSGVKDLRCDR